MSKRPRRKPVAVPAQPRREHTIDELVDLQERSLAATLDLIEALRELTQRLAEVE